jgi:hypothetical protein
MTKISMTSSSRPFHRFVRSSTALAFVLVVVTAVFMATHMQYWVEYPIPTYSPDSQTYLAIAFDISNGVLPVFDLRTPGYPLFLYAVLETTDSVSAVVLLQQLFTLSSAYVLCIVSFLIRRSLVLVSLIPSLGIVGSQRAQMYELWILPEAIYAALLVVVFACLLVGFVRRSRAWLTLASCAMGMAIFFRPSGLFLVGTYILVLVAFWLSGFRRDQIVSFAAPLPAMLLALCSYNYATIGKFTVSPFGPANLAAATATFWREVPGFPESVNLAIRKSQEEVSREDREALRVEWNPWRLSDVYRRYYNKFLWFRIVPALDAAGAKGMSAQVPYLARMSQLAITQDPVSYMKFVYTSLYMLFEGMGQADESPDQTGNYLRLYGEPRYLANGVHPAYESQLRYLERPDLLVRFRRFALREYETAPSGRAVPAGASLPGDGRADSPQRFSFWVRVAERYDRFVHRPFYVGKGWIVLLTTLAISSMFVLLRARRREIDTLAWLGFIVPLSAFGAVLLIALVEVGSARYLYPTRFLFYLAPLLMVEIYLQGRSTNHSARRQ